MTNQEIDILLRSTTKRFILFQIFCAFIFFGLIFSFTVGTGQEVFRTRSLENKGWIRIPAQLQTVKVDHVYRSYKVHTDNTFFRGYRNGSRRISGYRYYYSYAYEGKSYEGSSFSEGPSLAVLQENVPRTPGEATLIWVNPQDPSKSLFTFPARWRHFFLSCFIAATLIYIFYRLKKWIEKCRPELSYKFRAEFFSKRKVKR